MRIARFYLQERFEHYWLIASHWLQCRCRPAQQISLRSCKAPVSSIFEVSALLSSFPTRIVSVARNVRHLATNPQLCCVVCSAHYSTHCSARCQCPILVRVFTVLCAIYTFGTTRPSTFQRINSRIDYDS